jgi:hypothetical protein
MNRRERARLSKIYGVHYRRPYNLPLDRCSYCGDDRYCLDHVPPLSLIEGIDVGVSKSKGLKFIVFPSCKLCNSILSNRPIFSYLDRLEHLEIAYTMRIDRIELWSEFEINQLEGELRNSVQMKQNELSIYLNKHEFISNRIDSIYLGEFNEDDISDCIKVA